jgi:hypothetical protein
MEHESGTENTVPKLLDQAELLMQDFVEFQKQLILTKTMILNFDQLNNQLYLLEKEFQEFIIWRQRSILNPMKNYPTISLSGLFASIPIPLETVENL